MTMMAFVFCKGYLHGGVQLDKKPGVKVSGFACLQQNKAPLDKHAFLQPLE